MVYVKALGMRVQMWKELRQYFHWFESMASLPARFSHPVPFLCHSCASEYRPRLENFISTQHVKKKPAAKQF
jgi:hypothetical protein